MSVVEIGNAAGVGCPTWTISELVGEATSGADWFAIGVYIDHPQSTAGRESDFVSVW
jgi:hypothetical protein